MKSTYLKSPKHVRSQLSKPMSLKPNTQIGDFAVLSHTYTIYINHSCYPFSKITYGPLYIILTCQVLTMFLTKSLSLVFNTLPSDPKSSTSISITRVIYYMIFVYKLLLHFLVFSCSLWQCILDLLCVEDLTWNILMKA